MVLEGRVKKKKKKGWWAERSSEGCRKGRDSDRIK